MGNIEYNCLRQNELNKGEVVNFPKHNSEFGDEYKKKTTSDDILKVLTSEKSRPPQQARTYDNGTVRVSVF